jgi:methionyl-tRNA synthetase
LADAAPLSQRILVCLAWPYSNGSLHVGHLAGVYIPADIFARFHRLRGNEVLMVSGSDEHGTPITVRAEQEGVSPAEISRRYHEEFLTYWESLGISFDLYTRTGTDNHRRVAQDVFLKLLDHGYLAKQTMVAPYDPAAGRFLPDRYVEGVCPYCNFEAARGDQCDNCGRPLDAQQLGQPRSKLSGQPPEFRDTEHFFFDLPRLNEPLLDWARRQTHWRPNVYNFTQNFLDQGLQARPITRDLEWGVPVPVEGFEDKRLYVWFEAVIGYLSASIEWAANSDDLTAWERWWKQPARAYYFIGKDNIFFHSIIWPGMLMGYDGLNLPYDVPANEFMNYEGQQFSKSRGIGVWVPELLERFDPDPIRYAITTNLPETSDSDFSLAELVRRNNDELLATWGNLVHRTLTFMQRYFSGQVPEYGPVDPGVVQQVDRVFAQVTVHLEAVHFKDTIREVMALAQFGNRYFDEQAPWRQVKQDRQACADTLGALLYLINSLKVLFYPFLPHTSRRLHRLLGFEDQLDEHGWGAKPVAAGQALPMPVPLFTKLDT